MLLDQRQNLHGIGIRKAQTATNLLCHLHADLRVSIETNTIWRHAKRWRLAHIVQKSTPSLGKRARLRKIFEEQQRMLPHISFRMVLRRLCHSLHGGDFRQYFRKEMGGVE